jgi:uncharacterized repeat protein (TIGR01451 family)
MRFAILLGLSVMAPFSALLFGQEHEKIGHLYFTKTYRGADPLPQVLTVTGTTSGLEFAASSQTATGGEWLSVSPGSECCITPASLTVSVKPDLMLAAGNYSGQVVLTGSGSPQVIEVDLIVTPSHVPTFDRTPSQLSFSMQVDGEAPLQMMQINSLGEGSLPWAVIPSANFLKVSVESGTAPARISVGIIRDNLPGAGRISGVYTAQLTFVSSASTTTIPIMVAVGDTQLRWSHRLKAMKAMGALISGPTANPNPNLWPANTANCLCGHFNNEDTGYGGFALAPDGTNSGKLVVEANPGSGTIPHNEVLYQDLGSGPQTISFHLKPDIDNWAYLTSTVDGVVHNIWFNLSTGTPGNNVIPSGWVVHTPVSLGNGWYRYAVSFTAVSSAVYSGFGLATADQQYTFVATGGHGVFEWGQQAEHASAPSPYQSNDSPCMSATVQRDAGSVSPGLPMGFTISATNHATPSNATTLNAPLPAGQGINWSISPAFGGPGTCAITGPVSTQTLACDFSVLAPGTSEAVHIVSATTASSCGVYQITATATGAGVQFQSTDAMTVQCAGPVLSVTEMHTGSFAQGQTGATYTVVVSNFGTPTSGTVTVTETIPGGLTLTSMSGTGWSCPPGGTTCTRNDSLANSGSYDPITITVNVSGSAPSLVTNVVAVSGGGDTLTHTANDPTTILPQALRFVPVTPCRIADTRNPNGPFGGPAIAGGATRDFAVTASACGIPANAVSYSLNVTVVPQVPLSFLTVWPSGQAKPTVSTLNSLDGRIKANAAIVPAGTNGAISVFASDTTNVVIDINGYFVPVSVAQSMAFYAVTPCRLADTRNPTGTFGGPSMVAGAARNFPVQSSTCGIPATAQAYVINMTVVPKSVLGFLATWPSGSQQPLVSTLNALTGAITSNLAIVPAGTGGAISVYVTDRTDLIMDITGYFAPPGAASLDFYSVSPCRVLDTRGAADSLGGPILPGGASRSFPVPSSSCGIPATAQAYSMNATVVPPASLGFLTLWGSGTMPLASTLNSLDASIVANAVLVPAGASGVVTAYTTDPSQLILDINGYFK